MHVEVKRLRREDQKRSKVGDEASPSVPGHRCSHSCVPGHRARKPRRVIAMTVTACGRASGAPSRSTRHNGLFVRVNVEGGFSRASTRLRADGAPFTLPPAWFCKPVASAPPNPGGPASAR